MKKLRRLPRLSLENYTLLAVLLVAGGLLAFRLVSLLPGMSTYEQVLPSVSSSLHTLWELPINLPLILARGFVAAVSPSTGIGLSRLPNVLLALILALMMFWLLKRWYGYRLALFGMLLLLTAPWFLRTGRLASSDIVYPLGMTTVLVLAALWHGSKRGRLLLYFTAATSAILLYIPGMIWLLIGVGVIERRSIWQHGKSLKKHALLSLLLALTLLIPMAHSLVLHWQNIKLFVGLPIALPTVLGFAQEFARVWQYLFIGGWHNPVYNLSGLPIVTVVVSILVIVGIYLHSKHPSSSRTRTHLYLWLIGTILIAPMAQDFSTQPTGSELRHWADGHRTLFHRGI